MSLSYISKCLATAMEQKQMCTDIIDATPSGVKAYNAIQKELWVLRAQRYMLQAQSYMLRARLMYWRIYTAFIDTLLTSGVDEIHKK